MLSPSHRRQAPSTPPASMFEYLLLLLFPRVGFHGAPSSRILASLACHLLGLFGGRPADGPVPLSEEIGLDGCRLCQLNVLWRLGYNPPSTQYGHSTCARLTLPQPEHFFSAVMSFSPLPAMNRCRFLRYDVFFFGTALSKPSHISDSEGNDGSDSDGIASAAKGVGSVRNGCDRRCKKGRFRTGRTGPLRAGSSVCQSGAIGRASAIVRGVNRGWAGAGGFVMMACGGGGIKCRPRSGAPVAPYPVDH